MTEEVLSTHDLDVQQVMEYQALEARWHAQFDYVGEGFIWGKPYLWVRRRRDQRLMLTTRDRFLSLLEEDQA